MRKQHHQPKLTPRQVKELRLRVWPAGSLEGKAIGDLHARSMITVGRAFHVGAEEVLKAILGVKEYENMVFDPPPYNGVLTALAERAAYEQSQSEVVREAAVSTIAEGAVTKALRERLDALAARKQAALAPAPNPEPTAPPATAPEEPEPSTLPRTRAAAPPKTKRQPFGYHQLTHAQGVEIHRLRRRYGMVMRDIAHIIGCSDSTVDMVLNFRGKWDYLRPVIEKLDTTDSAPPPPTKGGMPVMREALGRVGIKATGENLVPSRPPATKSAPLTAPTTARPQGQPPDALELTPKFYRWGRDRQNPQVAHMWRVRIDEARPTETKVTSACGRWLYYEEARGRLMQGAAPPRCGHCQSVYAQFDKSKPQPEPHPTVANNPPLSAIAPVRDAARVTSPPPPPPPQLPTPTPRAQVDNGARAQAAQPKTDMGTLNLGPAPQPYGRSIMAVLRDIEEAKALMDEYIAELKSMTGA